MMLNQVEMPRLVVAGTASGVGKTTFTVGLVRALRSCGLKVAVFKCGPDYLDHLSRARSREGFSQPGWLDDGA
jgi:cobyrinic acid a,c-diamide synthase